MSHMAPSPNKRFLTDSAESKSALFQTAPSPNKRFITVQISAESQSALFQTAPSPSQRCPKQRRVQINVVSRSIQRQDNILEGTLYYFRTHFGRQVIFKLSESFWEQGTQSLGRSTKSQFYHKVAVVKRVDSRENKTICKARSRGPSISMLPFYNPKKHNSFSWRAAMAGIKKPQHKTKCGGGGEGEGTN